MFNLFKKSIDIYIGNRYNDITLTDISATDTTSTDTSEYDIFDFYCNNIGNKFI